MRTPQETLEHAQRLATEIWRNHYHGDAPNFRPFEDIDGVLTQIDNMVSGMERTKPKPEWTQSTPTEIGLYWLYRPARLHVGPILIEVTKYTYLRGDLGVILPQCLPMRLTDEPLRGAWWLGPAHRPSPPQL